jgi:hypothetical protein
MTSSKKGTKIWQNDFQDPQKNQLFKKIRPRNFVRKSAFSSFYGKISKALRGNDLGGCDHQSCYLERHIIVIIMLLYFYFIENVTLVAQVYFSGLALE